MLRFFQYRRLFRMGNGLTLTVNRASVFDRLWLSSRFQVNAFVAVRTRALNEWPTKTNCVLFCKMGPKKWIYPKLLCIWGRFITGISQIKKDVQLMAMQLSPVNRHDGCNSQKDVSFHSRWLFQSDDKTKPNVEVDEHSEDNDANDNNENHTNHTDQTDTVRSLVSLCSSVVI